MIGHEYGGALASLLCGLVLASTLAPWPARAQTAEETDPGGDDVAKPVHRIDVRTRFTDKIAGDDLLTHILRYERPSRLARRDAVTYRIDIPINGSDETGDDVTTDGPGVGLGDILMQLSYSRETGRSRSYGLGAQLVAPTATDQRFGTGKWRIVPLVSYRWPTPSLSPGSYFSLQARYDVSIAGDADRRDVQLLKWSPTLNIALRKGISLTLYPSTEMRYDLEKGSLFIPFNASISKRWATGVITSIEGAARMFGEDDAPYDWKLEARVGVYY